MPPKCGSKGVSGLAIQVADQDAAAQMACKYSEYCGTHNSQLLKEVAELVHSGKGGPQACMALAKMHIVQACQLASKTEAHETALEDRKLMHCLVEALCAAYAGAEQASFQCLVLGFQLVHLWRGKPWQLPLARKKLQKWEKLFGREDKGAWEQVLALQQGSEAALKQLYHLALAGKSKGNWQEPVGESVTNQMWPFEWHAQGMQGALHWEDYLDAKLKHVLQLFKEMLAVKKVLGDTHLEDETPGTDRQTQWGNREMAAAMLDQGKPLYKRLWEADFVPGQFRDPLQKRVMLEGTGKEEKHHVATMEELKALKASRIKQRASIKAILATANNKKNNNKKKEEQALQQVQQKAAAVEQFLISQLQARDPEGNEESPEDMLSHLSMQPLSALDPLIKELVEHKGMSQEEAVELRGYVEKVQQGVQIELHLPEEGPQRPAVVIKSVHDFESSLRNRLNNKNLQQQAAAALWDRVPGLLALWARVNDVTAEGEEGLVDLHASIEVPEAPWTTGLWEHDMRDVLDGLAARKGQKLSWLCALCCEEEAAGNHPPTPPSPPLPSHAAQPRRGGAKEGYAMHHLTACYEDLPTAPRSGRASSFHGGIYGSGSEQAGSPFGMDDGASAESASALGRPPGGVGLPVTEDDDWEDAYNWDIVQATQTRLHGYPDSDDEGPAESNDADTVEGEGSVEDVGGDRRACAAAELELDEEGQLVGGDLGQLDSGTGTLIGDVRGSSEMEDPLLFWESHDMHRMDSWGGQPQDAAGAAGGPPAGQHRGYGAGMVGPLSKEWREAALSNQLAGAASACEGEEGAHRSSRRENRQVEEEEKELPSRGNKGRNRQATPAKRPPVFRPMCGPQTMAAARRQGLEQAQSLAEVTGPIVPRRLGQARAPAEQQEEERLKQQLSSIQLRAEMPTESHATSEPDSGSSAQDHAIPSCLNTYVKQQLQLHRQLDGVFPSWMHPGEVDEPFEYRTDSELHEGFLKVHGVLRPATRGLILLHAAAALQQCDENAMNHLAGINSYLRTPHFNLPLLLACYQVETMVDDNAKGTLQALVCQATSDRGCSLEMHPLDACAQFLASAASTHHLRLEAGDGDRMKRNTQAFAGVQQYKDSLVGEVVAGMGFLSSRGRLLRSQRNVMCQFIEEAIKQEHGAEPLRWLDALQQENQKQWEDLLQQCKAQAEQVQEGTANALEFQQLHEDNMRALQRSQEQMERLESLKNSLGPTGNLAVVGLLPVRVLCHLHAFVCTQIGLSFSDFQDLDPSMREAVLQRTSVAMVSSRPAPHQADASRRSGGAAGCRLPQAPATGAGCAAPGLPIAAGKQGGRGAGGREAEEGSTAAEEGAWIALAPEALQAVRRAVALEGNSKEVAAASLALWCTNLTPGLEPNCEPSFPLCSQPGLAFRDEPYRELNLRLQQTESSGQADELLRVVRELLVMSDELRHAHLNAQILEQEGRHFLSQAEESQARICQQVTSGGTVDLGDVRDVIQWLQLAAVNADCSRLGAEAALQIVQFPAYLHQADSKRLSRFSQDAVRFRLEKMDMCRDEWKRHRRYVPTSRGSVWHHDFSDLEQCLQTMEEHQAAVDQHQAARGSLQRHSFAEKWATSLDMHLDRLSSGVQKELAAAADKNRQLAELRGCLFMRIQVIVGWLHMGPWTVSVVDKLGDHLARKLLPHLWQKKMYDEANRVLVEELEEESRRKQVAEEKKKKKKAKKVAVPAVKPEASPELSGEEEEAEEQEEEGGAEEAQAGQGVATPAIDPAQLEGFKKLLELVEQDHSPGAAQHAHYAEQQRALRRKRAKEVARGGIAAPQQAKQPRGQAQHAQQQEMDVAQPTGEGPSVPQQVQRDAAATQHSIEAQLRLAQALGAYGEDFSKLNLDNLPPEVVAARQGNAASPAEGAFVPASSAAAHHGKPRGRQVEKQGAEDVRVVGWMGDWLCKCGVKHPLRKGCTQCSEPAPCREWVRGKCTYPHCCHPHPPFDLPPKPQATVHGFIVTSVPEGAVYLRGRGGARQAASSGPVNAQAGQHAPSESASMVPAKVQQSRQAQAAPAAAAPAAPPATRALPPQLPPELFPPAAVATKPAAMLPSDDSPKSVAAGLGSQVSSIPSPPDHWVAPLHAQEAQRSLAFHPGFDLAPELSGAALPPVLATASSAGAAQELLCQPITASPAATSAVPGLPPHLLAAMLPVPSQQPSASAAAPPAATSSGGLLVLNASTVWICDCGRRNRKLEVPCGGCRGPPPCKEWCRGSCSMEACPHGRPHPPFEPSGNWKGKRKSRRLGEGAPGYTPPSSQPQAAADHLPQAAPAAAAHVGVPRQHWPQQAGWSSSGAGNHVPAAAPALAPAALLPVLPGAPPAANAAPPPAVPAVQGSPLHKLLQTAGMEAKLSPMRPSLLSVDPEAGGLPQRVAPQEDDDELSAMLQSMGCVQEPAAGPVSDSAAALRQHSQPHQEPVLREPQVASHLQAFLPVSGLSNDAGEYNCFLNAIIQCLWHCRDFRRQVAAWPSYLCDTNAVLHAVHNVFAALSLEETQRKRTGQQQDTSQSVVSPNLLREALSTLPGELFKAGEMNDAGEVLLTIFELIKQGVAALTHYGLMEHMDLDAVFGLAVREFVYCSACGTTTHSTRYTQYFYNTQATGIREMRRAQKGRPSTLGLLLRMIEEQTLKSCDPDEGGCSTKLPAIHALERAPRVFTLQLAWESHNEDPINIAATLAAVSERVDLHSVYRGVVPGEHVYHLRSMVCYYGAHYFAFVLLPEQQAWVQIDDTRASRVGSWADVRHKCELGRVQPSMLFYEAQS